MNLIEKYNATLDERAEQFRLEAELAQSNGDERSRSMALMQQSMLGDMLKALGRVEHAGRRGTLQRVIDGAEAAERAQKARGDYDAANREAVKARTVRWAKETLERLEASEL